MARRDSTPGGRAKGACRRPATGLIRLLADGDSGFQTGPSRVARALLRLWPALGRPARAGAALLCFLSGLLLPAGAGAIVIRHDQADSHYVVTDTDYPQVFFLHTRYGNRVCVATLIAPDWAITAAHCAHETPILAAALAGEPYALRIAGEEYQLAELVIHPDFVRRDYERSVDLALLRLDRPVQGTEPLALYRGAEEEGSVAEFLGWGYTGIGTRGRSANDGKLRRAENRVQTADKWLRFRFDDPREAGTDALPLEGVAGLGDSGGPAILDRDGQRLLMGVALGELEDPDCPDRRQGSYGAIGIYERISRHLDWIDAQVGR